MGTVTKSLGNIITLGLLVIVALTGCKGSSTSISATPNAIWGPTPTQTATQTFLSPALIPIQVAPTAFSTSPSSSPSPAPPPLLTPTLVYTYTPSPTETVDVVAETSCGIKHVVIISLDGLRPDAWQRADTPTLDALRVEGAYTPNAQAVLPSVTLVSHASMLGGMSPEKHGIYWNVHNMSLGMINGPTLFSVAHEAGLSTAMVVGKPRFEHIALPGSVDTYDYAGFTDRQVVDHTLAMLQTGLPNVLFVHLPDIDTVGHSKGWMSREQLIAVSLTDGLVGEIVAELEADDYRRRTLLIVTSDHGGIGTRHGDDSPEEVNIPWLAVGPGMSTGFNPEREIIIYDTAATALYALGLPIPTEWDGQPVLEVFNQNSCQR